MKGDFLLREVAFILAILTSALYVLGYTFYQGYLSEFGIDDSLFPISFDMVLFQGFFSFATMGFKAAFWFFLASLFVAITVIFYVVLKVVFRKYINLAATQILSKFIKQDELQKSELDEHPFMQFSENMMKIGGVVVIGFLLIFVVVLASSHAGKEAGLAFKKRAKDGSLKELHVDMKEEGESFDGYSVMCNENLCGYLLSNGMKVKIVPLDDIRNQLVALKTET